jgi:hypothetical protein
MSLPAPHGGWNVRDSVSDMPSQDAVILDNWLPQAGHLELRKGYAVHASGMSGQMQTIMQWEGSSGQKMFAANTTSVWNATSAGAVGAADITGLTNGRWQWVNFSTAGGDFLVACNGADAVRNYNGTTWTTPTLTGAPGGGNDFDNVTVHKERLFFVEKNSTSFWVLNVKSIAGTATEVPLGSFTYKGGSLVAQFGWTIDGGQGQDDLLVSIFSTGETLVFQGNDPTDALNWSLVGRFNLGRPAGKRCFEKIAGDLMVLTEDGYQSLAAALKAGRSDPNTATSDKIRGAVGEIMMLYRDNFGWQAVLFPKAGFILVNVPIIVGSLYQQHVFSIRRKAWCRFTNITSVSWGMLDDDLYFGGADGVVYKFWGTDSDNGADIVTDAQQAFGYFKSLGRRKRFLQIRPVLEASASIIPSLGMSTDFVVSTPQGTAEFAADNTSVWDESVWDEAPWAGGNEIQAAWKDVVGEGISGGLRMILRCNTAGCKWHATDYVFEVGTKF